MSNSNETAKRIKNIIPLLTDTEISNIIKRSNGNLSVISNPNHCFDFIFTKIFKAIVFNEIFLTTAVFPELHILKINSIDKTKYSAVITIGASYPVYTLKHVEHTLNILDYYGNLCSWFYDIYNKIPTCYKNNVRIQLTLNYMQRFNQFDTFYSESRKYFLTMFPNLSENVLELLTENNNSKIYLNYDYKNAKKYIFENLISIPFLIEHPNFDETSNETIFCFLTPYCIAIYIDETIPLYIVFFEYDENDDILDFYYDTALKFEELLDAAPDHLTFEERKQIIDELEKITNM